MKGPLLEKFIRLLPAGKPLDAKTRDAAFETLREAEEKYHSIFDNAVEGIFQTTPEGTYLSANPALARIYGYESPAELIASVKDIRQQIYVNPNRRNEFVGRMQENDVVVDFESEIYQKNGEKRWILENVRAVRNAKGALRYYEGTVQDITERKRAEEALVRSQEALASELAEAAQYMRSLLPPRQVQPLAIDWRYLSSSQLGGDAFGYQWLDQDHLGIYLLDVSGHGIGAALLSITVMNVMRARSLQGADFYNPASVLMALHGAFPFAQQNGKYFTMWYAVYHRRTRQLFYASGGHHGAVLVSHGEPTQILKTNGPLIGVVEHPKFSTGTVHLPMQGRLYIFSDGAFEITRANGEMTTFGEFVHLLEAQANRNGGGLEAILDALHKERDGLEFEDDLSIIELILS
ncbi:MAG: SpoIIE family protein phosphatase [Chthoniobacteraceae bacterium]